MLHCTQGIRRIYTNPNGDGCKSSLTKFGKSGRLNISTHCSQDVSGRVHNPTWNKATRCPFATGAWSTASGPWELWKVSCRVAMGVQRELSPQCEKTGRSTHVPCTKLFFCWKVINSDALLNSDEQWTNCVWCLASHGGEVLAHKVQCELFRECHGLLRQLVAYKQTNMKDEVTTKLENYGVRNFEWEVINALFGTK